MRILIAEDDKDQLQLRSLLLLNSGYETIAVSTTGGGVARSQGAASGMRLVDLKLPTEAMGSA